MTPAATLLLLQLAYTAAGVHLLGEIAAADLVPVGPQVTVADGPVSEAHDVAINATGETLVVWSNNPTGDADVLGRLYAADGAPAGPAFVVATYTTGDQLRPAVAVDGAGNFIIVWDSEGRDGGGFGVYGQRLDATGAPIGTDFIVNTYTTGHQLGPSVDAAPDGRFVVAWGTSAQRFDANGAKDGPEIVVTPAPGFDAKVALDDAGNFVVAWEQAGFHQINFQRFAADGSPIGSPALGVLSMGIFGQGSFDVAMAPDGRFVLTRAFGDNVPCDLVARRYDAAGVAVGPAFTVSTYPNGYCLYPSIAVDDAGGFMIAWSHQKMFQEQPRDGDDSGVFAQRYDAVGTPDGGNLRVNRFRRRGQLLPAVALDANGNAVVAFVPELHFELLGLALTRFCQEDDPTCDRCPGSDVDTDGDGVPDGCDLCTNVLGEQTMSAVQVVATDHFVEPQSQNQFYKGVIRVSGGFTLAGPPGAFGTINPAADGVGFRLAAPDGAIVVDAALGPGVFAGPGTAGWQLTSAGPWWIYRDRTPEPVFYGGRLSAVIENRSTPSAPNFARVTIRGKRGEYQAVADDVVVDATVVFGDQTASNAGRCAETSFLPADCTSRTGPKQHRIACAD